ncbi:hypothetical protein V6N11_038460 [Hibiscus sabdariffa]|uniref:Uncharacterized protein n=1 Tax=Hibiscus sabdariffa TaxID=183260 RepID=A0ABR2SKV7_9ROSI
MVLGLRDQTEWEGPGVSLRPLDQGVGCSVVGLQIRAVGSIRESLLSEPSQPVKHSARGWDEQEEVLSGFAI